MKEINKLIIKAKKGNIKSIRNLALKYYFGDKKNKIASATIPKNSEKAVRWLKIGVSKGDTGCLDLLGYCYHMGDGVEQNNIKAKEYWELSAKKGSSAPLYNLGIFYENGWSVPKDTKKALFYYNKNIKKNNPYKNKSLKGIGRIYIYKGDGVKKNLKKGINCYKLAAKGGDLRAIFELANMYDENESFERYKDIKKNPALSYKYYLLLSKKKFIFGDVMIAEICLKNIKNGIDINRNIKKYLKHMNLATKNMNIYSDMIDQMSFPRNVTIDLKNSTKKLYAKLKRHLYKNRDRKSRNHNS